MKLTDSEIKKRMVELQNLRKLHTRARNRVLILESENKNLKLRVTVLEKENKELKRELSDIKYQLTELQTILFKKKATDRDISSFDDDEPKPPVQRTTESYKRPIPKASEVTKTIYHPLERRRGKTRKKTFYIEDIPFDIKKIVTRHVVTQEYLHGSWIGTVPVPTTPVVLGDNVRMLVSTLVTIERLSYTQVQNLLSILFHIHISEGEIANILHSESRNLKLSYESMKEGIQKEEYHHMDETSWKVKGESGFAWSMTGKSGDTVYDLGKSRGKGIAVYLRGGSKGVLISDDYGAYRILAEHHQLCFAHLLRKFRDIARDGDFTDKEKRKCSKHYDDLKLIYYDLKKTLLTDNPLSHHSSFTKRFEALSSPSSLDPKPLTRIKETLRRNISKYLTCLTFPTIPLTNNTAERSLRHLVIKRKISFGSASQRGAETFSILLSVLLSLYRRDPASYFERYAKMRV
jgi:hypothetical protein